MANTPVFIVAPTGLALTLQLYPDGSDAIANGVGGDTLTEETNRKGLYQATVSQNISGIHYALAVDGGAAVQATQWLYLENSNSDFVAFDSHPFGVVQETWDRVLLGSTHNINNSAGKRLRQVSAVVFADGIAQSGGPNQIQLEVGDVSIDGQFVHSRILITAGTGTGQEAIITKSVASTDTLDIAPSWVVNPDATSEYSIIPAIAHAQTGNQGYRDGAVFIDSVFGNAGTIDNFNGTEENPSDTLTDATTVAANITPVASRHFIQRKGSSMTLGQTYVAFVFNGAGGSTALGGQDISLCTFLAQVLSGIGTGTGRVFVRDCLLSGVSMNDAAFTDCSLIGTFTITDTGLYSFDMCIPQDTSNPPTIDMGAAVANTNVELLAWNGPVIISNLGASGVDTLYVAGNGKVTLDATCIAGTLTLAGNIELELVDPVASAGVTIDQTANMVEWKQPLDMPGQEKPTDKPTLSVATTYLYKFLVRNKKTQTATELKVFDDDGITVDHKAIVSSDGTTAIKGEMETGP